MKRKSPDKALAIRNRIEVKASRDKQADFKRTKCGRCKGTGWLNAGGNRDGIWECDLCLGSGKSLEIIVQGSLPEITNSMLSKMVLEINKN